MKKVYLVLFALAVLVTPYAEAKTCYGISCNYIDAATNSGFASNGAYWTYDPGVTFPTETSCYSSKVAELDNGEAIWRFPLIDAAYSSYKLSFRAYLPGDTNNFYDELTVTVTNRDTGVSESMVLHGSSYDTHCASNQFYLANDYDYADVTVTFESGGFSNHKWQIDDVGFWAYY
jgi:hypothetical protein